MMTIPFIAGNDEISNFLSELKPKNLEKLEKQPVKNSTLPKLFLKENFLETVRVLSSPFIKTSWNSFIFKFSRKILHHFPSNKLFIKLRHPPKNSPPNPPLPSKSMSTTYSLLLQKTVIWCINSGIFSLCLSLFIHPFNPFFLDSNNSLSPIFPFLSLYNTCNTPTHRLVVVHKPLPLP